MKTSIYILASRPSGLPAPENFLIENSVLPELKEGEVLLKSWYISVDPYMRGRMNDVKSYAASWELGQPVSGGVVASVLESKSKSLNSGDTVFGMLPWATYSIENADKLRKVDAQKVHPGYYLGVLGMPGLTAYFGMKEICKPGPGETVVVSGAAGAVGITAGQIAKLQGARVIGIAGSDEKCRMLREEFGYDETINYKTSKSIRKEIAELCPGGVDAYFDNVGGEITDAVVQNLGFNSRIALCGQISQYNSTKIYLGPTLLPMFLTRSVLLKGFIVSNYSDRFGEGLSQLIQWVTEGKIKSAQTIIEGFDKLPEAFLGLFSGANKGKMLVKID